MKTPILAFINQKGGVGKTTCAVNVAGALAAQGKRVLVVDTDAQRSATMTLGTIVGPDTIYSALMQGQNLMPCYPTGNPNVHCIPGDAASDEGEIRQWCLNNPLALKKGLALAGVTTFDFILIDCPNHRSPAVAMSLLAATCAILVVKCEPLSIPGLIDATATVEQARSAGNHRLQVRALINDYVKRGTSDEVVADVRAKFPQATFQTVVPRSAFLADSILYASQGGAVVDYAKKSKPAASFRELASEIQTQFGVK